ncbi:MAG: TrmH family RNA methyltransferase [Bacillota bacterium]
MKNIISSEKNDKIKYLKKLYNSSKRKKEGKFILEGFRLIKQAYKSGAKFDYLFITDSFANSKEYKKLILNNDLQKISYLINEKLLKKISDTVNPQGIIAIVSEINYNISQIVNKTKKILVLDRIQDPGNLGTIIRTAAASGFGAVISLKGTVDIYNLKVLRATAGAVFNIPFLNKIDYNKFKRYLNKEFDDFQLICADVNTKLYYHKVEYAKKNILVIGNEGNGIRNELLDKADLKIKIPLNYNIESINAAMAAGILMYKINYG